MTLPAPNLDDRRFQDLVDEAKRLVQERCPEWTDHNVSDPGITLIEAFAFMVDQLLYRLNRVTDLHYLRYLDLIGVRRFPPAPARCDLTFMLAAARKEPVTVPKGTQVATESVPKRTEAATESKVGQLEDPIVFTTQADLLIVPCSLTHLSTGAVGSVPVDQSATLAEGTGVDCFSRSPGQGDAVYFGLSNAVPGCLVSLTFACAPAGPGVDPRDPPLEWQHWDGEAKDWASCELGGDTTGGLTQDGVVDVHVPGSHAASVVGEQRAGWLRCRVVEARDGQPTYSATPRLMSVSARTVGGTVAAFHADVVADEIVGMAEGVPGQRLSVQHPPMLADEPMVVRVRAREGTQEWTEVSTFAASGPGDRHVMVDRAAGQIVFGPAVRQEDGSLLRYGDVPEKGAIIQVPYYLTGGGSRGNVARGKLVVQREPVPFVKSVVNIKPAVGGVEGESVANAAARGPLQLRIRDRAVTAEDYEELAREAAPEAARIKCVPASDQGVRVLVVPRVEAANMSFEHLQPSKELVRKIGLYLDKRRCLGARVLVEPPRYQGVTVVARLKARSGSIREAVHTQALSALDAYLNPIVGGQFGTGWPFGRMVQSGDVHAVLQRVAGVELVEDIQLFQADPVTGDRGEPTQRIVLKPDTLVFSYRHQIRVGD
ncbi:putative baseplate assembly protein [Nonomuraea endophytica]|uniref:putative baseplate assembly protein n=1 Tax=Nonomuraea endophytica TaxID=714136 RepID=UPI0037C7C138